MRQITHLVKPFIHQCFSGFNFCIVDKGQDESASKMCFERSLATAAIHIPGQNVNKIV